MKKLIAYLLLSLFLILQSCGIGKVFKDVGRVTNDINGVTVDVRELKQELLPFDSLMIALTSGLIHQLSHEQTTESLDSLTARINRMLTKYLNQTFANIDAAPIGQKLAKGVLDPLLAIENEERIKSLLTAISIQVSTDLSNAINNIYSTLTSDTNQAKLNGLLAGLYNKDRSDSLSIFLNRVITQIDLKHLGDELADGLSSAKLRPEIDSIARTAVRAILEEVNRKDNLNNVFGNIRNIIFLALGGLGLIMAGLFWWNRGKYIKVNKMLLTKIEDINDRVQPDLKKEIEMEASNRGVLKELDFMLKKVNLAKRSEMQK